MKTLALVWVLVIGSAFGPWYFAIVMPKRWVAETPDWMQALPIVLWMIAMAVTFGALIGEVVWDLAGVLW